MYKILQWKKEALKDDLVKFTQELVRTPSVSSNEKDIAKIIENKMKELGYDEVIVDEAGNVIGILAGRHGGPTLLLNSHMDTVPTGDVKDWKKNPYCGEIENDKIYGVGTADCKGGLAAQIYSGVILRESLLPLDGNIIVAATVSEENGLSVGVRYLIDSTLKELQMTPDYAILGEPTNLSLYYGHDGWIEMDIKVEGNNPFQVDDAAKEIFNDLDLSLLKSKNTQQMEELSIYQPTFEEKQGYRSATIRMSRRLRETDNVNDVLGQIKHNATLIAQSAGSVAVDVLVRQENKQLDNGSLSVVKKLTHAWSTDPFNPIMERSRQALSTAGCVVKTGKWTLDRLHMGTAGSVLVSEYQIPTIGFGPGDEKQAHACDETVSIDNLSEAAYGTAAIAHSLVGTPVFGWTSDEI